MQGSGISISIATKSDLVLRDLDLIKTFPNARVSWSINTLDEKFRKEMDRGVSIERRLEAMRQFYEAGVQTTCFISPIFPGITDVQAIIERAKNQCNLVWLENLNLRGDYRGRILDWIHQYHPELDSLYHDIYTKKDRTYWSELDGQLRSYCEANGFRYVRKSDSSALVADGDLMERALARSIRSNGGYATVPSFMNFSGLSKYSATKKLNAWCHGADARLRKRKVGHTRVYELRSVEK